MVWFELAMLVVTFIASQLLIANPHLTNPSSNLISDVGYPTASANASIPFGFGTYKMGSANTLWVGDFYPLPLTQNVGGSLFIKPKKQIIGYDYYYGMDLALGMGPDLKMLAIFISDSACIWADPSSPALLTASNYKYHDVEAIPSYIHYSGDLVGVDAVNDNRPIGYLDADRTCYQIWSECTTILDNGNGVNSPGGQTQNGFKGWMRYYNGGFNQPADGYVANQVGTVYPAMGGVAHIVFESCFLGTGTTTPKFWFEMQYLTNSLGIPDGKHIIGLYDANPMEILYRMICDEWQGLGYASSTINAASWIAAALQLWTEGLGMSGFWDQGMAKDHFDDVMKACQGIAYEDPTDGQIYMKLIRSDYTVADLPVLSENVISSVKSFQTQAWSQTYNQYRFKFADRNNNYIASAVLSQDFGNYNMQGVLRTQDETNALVVLLSSAQLIADRELSLLSVPLYKVELTMDRTGAQLRPGDVVNFAWENYGITEMIMRVQTVDLGTLENGETTIALIQDQFGSNFNLIGAEVSLYQTTIVYPAAVVTYYIDEAPYWFLMQATEMPASGNGRVLALAKSPQVASGGYTAYSSVDGYTNPEVTGTTYSDTASLVNPYNVVNDNYFDNTVGMLVISPTDTSTWQLAATDAQLRAGANLFVLDKEFMNFTTYTQNADGSFLLSGIRRALMDSVIQTHSNGATLFFLNSASGLFTSEYSPQTVGVKLIDQARQRNYPVDQAISVPVVVQNRPGHPLPVDLLFIDGSRSPVVLSGDRTLTWIPRTRLATGLTWEDDAVTTSPPGIEDGATYVVRTSQDNGASWTESAATSSPYTLSMPSGSGILMVQVVAILDGLRSLYNETVSVQFGSSILTRDGSALVTRDGAVVLPR